MLDLKDMKLLYLLSKNSRISKSKLGKEIGLSSESIKNRINKLQNNNLIKSFKININYKKLGFNEYDIYLRLKNYNESELKRIISFLEKNKHVTWIGTCFGKYDLRLSIITKDNEDVSKFITNFQKKFSKYYEDVQIVYLIEKYKIDQKKIMSNLFNIDSKKLGITKEINKPHQLFNKNENLLILDETEKKLIKNMNNNPTQSLIKLSNEIKLTPEACKYRLSELNKKEIITSFSLILDTNKLNKIRAVFLFNLDSIDDREISEFISQSESISAFVKIMGNWNYSVSVFANNVSEIHHILMSFRNKFPDIIKDYELLLLFETYKYPMLPEVIFE